MHRGDNFDEGFRDKYVGQDWISENVVRFRGRHARTAAGAEVIVENRSGGPIQGIRIELSHDLLLLFDLPANSTATAPIAASRPGERLELAVSGRRDGSALIPYTYERFPETDNGDRWRGKLMVTISHEGGVGLAAIPKAPVRD